jgi:hypothetical protein
MAACTPDLNNVNMLTPVGFRLSIDEDLKFMEYFCVAVSLPTAALPEVSGTFRNKQYRIPGESLSFDSLSVEFIVDEEMANYNEIFNWLTYNSNNDELKYRDMTLSILTNQNTSNKQISFHNAIPTSLEGVTFDTRTTDIEYLTSSVTFAYDSFEFV